MRSVIPILQLQKQLIASIQEELSDEEALAFQFELLKRSKDLDNSRTIIDVSNLDVLDSYMSKILTDLTSALRLQGSKVVLCGVQPVVASALVDMGMSLGDIDCYLTLDHAFMGV